MSPGFFEFWGGFGLLYLGLGIFRESFQSVFGALVPKALSSLIDNRVVAYFVGFFVAVLVQSGSIATTSVIGFVNAGLMNSLQAASFSLGAQLGGALTFWGVLAFDFVNTGALVLVGLVLYVFARWTRFADISRIIMGIALVFIGLQWMIQSAGMASAWLEEERLWILFLAGAVCSFLMRSSLVVLATAFVLLASSVYSGVQVFSLVLGAHFGVAFIVIFRSLPGAILGKRVALIHSISKVLPIFFIMFFTEEVWILMTQISPSLEPSTQLVLLNTLFLLGGTLTSLSLLGFLNKVTCLLIPDSDKKEPQRLVMLDSVSRIAASLSLEQVAQEIEKFAAMVQSILNLTAAFWKAEEQSVLDEHRQKIVKYVGITRNIKAEVIEFLNFILCRRLNPSQVRQVKYMIELNDELSSICEKCLAVLDCKEKSGQAQTSDSLLENVIAEYEEVLTQIISKKVPNISDFDLKTNLYQQGDFLDYLKSIQLSTKNIAQAFDSKVR